MREHGLAGMTSQVGDDDWSGAEALWLARSLVQSLAGGRYLYRPWVGHPQSIQQSRGCFSASSINIVIHIVINRRFFFFNI